MTDLAGAGERVPDGPRPITLRSIAPAAFLPPGLFSVAIGAITPVVPITATGLGASAATAAVVVALLAIGQLLADAPAGAAAAKFGEHRAMMGAGVVCAVALVVAMLAPSLLAFAAAIFLMGLGQAVWMLARLTFVAELVPAELRARAMSTLGGVQRAGLLVGPFLGAGVVHLVGTRGAYGLAVVAALASVLVLAVVPEPDEPTGRSSEASAATYMQMLRSQRRVFFTVGVGVLLVSVVRNSRRVILPLWGQYIGLDPVTISVIYGVSAAFDVLLFYPAGRFMDLHGRRSAAVCCTAILAVAHLMLPLMVSLPGLLCVAILLGVGNGIGSGLLMTIGADLAPPGQRPVFFGVWRLISDTGHGISPFLLAGLTAAISLSMGVVAIGLIGVAATAALARWVPRRQVSDEGRN